MGIAIGKRRGWGGEGGSKFGAAHRKVVYRKRMISACVYGNVRDSKAVDR